MRLSYSVIDARSFAEMLGARLPEFDSTILGSFIALMSRRFNLKLININCDLNNQ